MENISRIHRAYMSFCSRKQFDILTKAFNSAVAKPSYASPAVAKQVFRVQEALYSNSTNVGSKDLTQSVKFGYRKQPCRACIGNRTFRKHLTPTQQRHVKNEVRAFRGLVRRSGLPVTTHLLRRPTEIGVRWLSTSNSLWQQNPRSSDNNPNDPNKEDPQDEEKMPFMARLMLLFWLSFLLYVVMRLQTGEDSSLYKFVSWNEFVHDMLAKGEVEEVIVRPESEVAFIRLYPGAVVKGRKADSDFYTLKIVDSEKFEDKIRKAETELGVKPEQGIAISYQRESSWTPLIFMAIVGLVVFLVFRNIVKIQLPNPTEMFASERKAKFVRVDLQTMQGRGVSFKDVAGLKEAKVEVMEFVDYLKRPEKYKELGGKIPHGALLTGPPGCGKTLLAKAVATEAQVPFLATAGPEFVEMLGGLGAARVRDLFKEARQNAPCIIYIDEIDAIGRKRSGNNSGGGGMQSSEEEHTLNQLLVEMDGMGTTDGVILLGSTNRADVLDNALLRPGRFDRHILIDLPTLVERKEIFSVYLKRLQLAASPDHYNQRLAQLSPGMSGADIANICNEAALHAARDNKKKVDVPDFEYAVERVVAGAAKKSSILGPQEKRIVAYHEAGHAVIGWLLKHTDALLKVTIVPRTSKALGFAQYTPKDNKLFSKEELFERMCMALGGRVSEAVHFNSITSGAQDDLQKVTKMAYAQIRNLGMNDNVGLVSFPDGETETQKKIYSRTTATLIDSEARKMVANAYKATEALILENKDKIKAVAEALLERETLSYADMEELIGAPPHGHKTVIHDVWETASESNPSSSESM